MSSKQALVFGASGISGWAIARTCLTYPSTTTFSRVVACSNRKIDKTAFLLEPKLAGRLDIRSNIDLLGDLETVVSALHNIDSIAKITHVYYVAYTSHGDDYHALKTANVRMLKNAVEAITQLCPLLEFWTFQTGSKAYGIEFHGQPGVQWEPPLSEKTPRLQEPLASNIVYYEQHDFLMKSRGNQTWKFCDIRPDVIIGHTPHPNGIGFAHTLGIFLAMYATIEGKGSEVVFPGDEKAWISKRSDSSQDIIAKMHVFASLNPDLTSGRTFNVADEPIATWVDIWPQVCAYFGLKGVGPRPTSDKATGVAWVMEHKDYWQTWVKNHGLQEGIIENSNWYIMGLAFSFLDFDRQYDLSASRSVEFTESCPTYKGYEKTFDRMKEARVIPM